MSCLSLSTRSKWLRSALLPPALAAIILAINPFADSSLFAQETQKPADKKPNVLLSEQEWKAVEGIFQSAARKEMYVEFKAGDGALVAKLLWNNNELHLIPESPLSFTSRESGDEGPIHIRFT